MSKGNDDLDDQDISFNFLWRFEGGLKVLVHQESSSIGVFEIHPGCEKRLRLYSYPLPHNGPLDSAMFGDGPAAQGSTKPRI